MEKQEEIKPGKRGRKRKGYFYEEQEQAVIDFNASTNSLERDRIYNEWLRPAFTKMVESIIRRYKLYVPDEEYEETFNDTLSFLMTKISLFNPNKGFKAYSYCGTICKNYLLSRLNNVRKAQQVQSSYDAMYETIANSSNYVQESAVSEEEEFISSLISRTCAGIRKIIKNKEGNGLTSDEEKVGEALIDVFTNWDDIFTEFGSNKFNKSNILLYIKETTQLNTQQIRNAMRRYKAAYLDIKKILKEEEY